MKKIIKLLLFFTPVIIYSQNNYDINFRITDSVVVKKNYPYATKVNLEISVPNFQETIFLYNFDKCVFSSARSSIENSFDSRRLSYIIESENNIIIKYQSAFYNLLNPYSPGDKRNAGIVHFVNSKQKIIRKKLRRKKKYEYRLEKYEINSSIQNVAVFPFIGVFHGDLLKGEYWLYLTYSFNPGWQHIEEDIVKDPRTFKGRVVSNKVKLVVE